MYKSWSCDPTQGKYSAQRETFDRLPSGLYELLMDGYDNPIAHKLEIKEEKGHVFSNGPMVEILKEISIFRQQGDKYKKLGISHKRGLLLYGPPGCGKTGILSTIINETIKNDGLAIQLNAVRDFSDNFSRVRQIEKDRLISILIEDIEQLLSDEETLLELLDGFTSTGGNVLIVATTNKIDELPHRIKSRPSRIDTTIEVGYPSNEQRVEYLKFLMINLNWNESNKRIQIPLDEIINRTKDFSLAMLKELIIGLVIYEKSLDETLQKLDKLKTENNL